MRISDNRNIYDFRKALYEAYKAMGNKVMIEILKISRSFISVLKVIIVMAMTLLRLEI